MKDRAKRRVSDSLEGSYEPGEEVLEQQQQQRQRKIRPRRKRRRFSNQEKRDILISVILVTLVAISLLSSSIGPSGIFYAFQALFIWIAVGQWWFPVSLIASLLIAFLVHEMAHKFTAQHYNMWAEFRMTSSGYILSAMAIFLSIPIFGTGIVFTSGADSFDKEGKVNLAGPLSNFIMATIFAITTIFVPLIVGALTIPVYFFLFYGVVLNSTLGLFNMLPFQPLDGGTVFAWNRQLWLLLAISLGLLLIFGYFVMPMIGNMFLV